MSLPAVDAATPLFIVLNAGSGRDDADQTRATIERVLTEAGRTHEILAIDGKRPVDAVTRDAVERASRAKGAVVAAGGDGTINAVAQAVLGSGCAFGVLPQGTFNYFSRTHGIPTGTEAATRALLSAHVAPAQVGLVNDRVFLVNASIGLYPRLLENREQHKRKLGRSRLVALGSAFVTLLSSHRPLHLDINRDGRSGHVRTQTLFIANNALQLEQVGAAHTEVDGRLVSIALDPVGSGTMLRLLFHRWTGTLHAADEVDSTDFVELTAKPHRARGRSGKVKVATDGEICWMTYPLTFRVSPEPLALMMPSPEHAVPRA